MKKITFLITVLISVLNMNAQNDLWPNEAINTGANSTYVLVTDTDVTFDGQDFIYGKLGAFYTDDNGDLQNGGWIIWNNAQINFSRRCKSSSFTNIICRFSFSIISSAFSGVEAINTLKTLRYKL